MKLCVILLLITRIYQ